MDDTLRTLLRVSPAPYPSTGHCDVRVYRTDVEVGDKDSPVGCSAPARFDNPTVGGKDRFNYAYKLCATHYDELMEWLDKKRRGELAPWQLEF